MCFTWVKHVLQGSKHHMAVLPQPPGPSGLARLLLRVASVERHEIGALLWSFAYFFAVLCSYYILRPLRDEMSVTVGTQGLQWLFVIVFLVMLAAVPVFGWVVSSFERRRIVPIVYLFCISNLALFWLLFAQSRAGAVLAGAFFVWVSVFNLFAISLFWSVMSDAWHTEQAKRLYGFIAAGGSAGAISGPLVTHSLVHVLGPTNLLLVAASLLAVAIGCVRQLQRLRVDERVEPSRRSYSAGELLAGACRVFASPYLRKIALLVLLANLIGTYFYFEQTRIVGMTVADRADRVQFFARLDLTVNTLTVLIQLGLTGLIMRRAGIGASIAALPVSATLGLLALVAAPTLAVIGTVMVIERAVTFAIANPAVRVLYTVVAPEDKYKAQNFVDTVVFRGGDAASGWILNGLTRGLGAPAWVVAMLALPLAAMWLWLSLRLGREQAARAEAAGEIKPADVRGE